MDRGQSKHKVTVLDGDHENISNDIETESDRSDKNFLSIQELLRSVADGW